MTDRYQRLTRTGLGQQLVRRLGLPDPVTLERWHGGDVLVDGSVLLGGDGRLVEPIGESLTRLGITRATDEDQQAKAIVLDATTITASTDLVRLQQYLTPRLRRLAACGRVLLLGTPPELVHGGERVAQRALEGLSRSLGKELRAGSTVQLVYVAPGAEHSLDSTLAFLLSPRSAYVSGQVVRLGPSPHHEGAPGRHPLEGRVALVTGAARGIGAEIARVLHRDGARVVGVDVPRAAGDLTDTMAALDGDVLALDITHDDAPDRIVQRLTDRYGGVDVVVHNAGITRDRRLVNSDSERFGSVVAVNLTAPERITRALLDAGAVRPNGRIIGVASVAGIAGNLGQTSYATSKAGVIGLVDALAGTLPDGITANAVAPGFIETPMTAAVPFATREVGRRLNSLAQGGLPVDVAETVAWLAAPGSGGVDGQVVRVCGQMMLGA